MSWPLVSASMVKSIIEKSCSLQVVFISRQNLYIINFNLTAQPEITILNRLYALAASNMNDNWLPKHLHSSAKTR